MTTSPPHPTRVNPICDTTWGRRAWWSPHAPPSHSTFLLTWLSRIWFMVCGGELFSSSAPAQPKSPQDPPLPFPGLPPSRASPSAKRKNTRPPELHSSICSLTIVWLSLCENVSVFSFSTPTSSRVTRISGECRRFLDCRTQIRN